MVSTVEVVLIAAIPFIAGLVGWATNVVALHMTFYPLEFVGFWEPWVGWQGIIPRRAGKMSTIAVRLITTELLPVDELLAGIDAGAVSSAVSSVLRTEVDAVVARVGEKHAPTVWALTSSEVKAEVGEVAMRAAEEILGELMEVVTEDIEAFVDLEGMVVAFLSTHKAVLNELFQEVGAEEFDFIRRSGFVLGFGFGVIQMVVWIFFRSWWVLPLAGFVVGYATNWIALKIIFRPIHPHSICGLYTCHGLFLKRQEEVSAQYAALVADRLITPHKVFTELAVGRLSHKVYALLLAKVDAALDNWVGPGLPLTVLYLGANGYARLKRQIAHRMFVRLPVILEPAEAVTKDSMGLEPKLYDELVALEYDRFERMLHPIFEEDEIVLILVGAVLGLLVGGVQAGVQLSVA